ncbi:MAG: LacI family DNA-binding transcriptional regulator [Williamsia sp.]|nr:LacI family DNA-binding transcriptional regulator [Williamsia sp.]
MGCRERRISQGEKFLGNVKKGSTFETKCKRLHFIRLLKLSRLLHLFTLNKPSLALLKNSPGLKAVAEMAGVSVATVSRVLNQDASVKEATRRLVQKAIKKTGYHPNRVAQRLRATRKSRKLIGLLIPDIQNPFYVDVVRGIEEYAYAHDCAVVIGNFSQDAAKEKLYIDILRSESVDGFVVAPHHGRDQYVEALVEEGYALVCIDRGLTNVEVDVVMVDNQKGAYNATAHLIKMGHTRIAHITGNPSIPTTTDRILGYKAALMEHGIEIDPALVIGRESDFESGQELTRQLLEAPEPPSAIFTGNNLLTLGALDMIHRRKLKIPDDVAIVGFDDMYWATSLNPPLTAVRQSGYDIGKRAVELLYQRIEDPDRPAARVYMPTQLMVRTSCGPKK